MGGPPEHADGMPGSTVGNLPANLVANLSFEHLRTFLVIVRAGSFRQAADWLFVTQSAISQRVRFMEKHLQARLFDRQKGSAIYLTEVGNLLLPFAEEMLGKLGELDMAVADLRETTGDDDAIITIAAGISMMKYRLLDAVGHLNLQHPEIRLRLELGTSPDQIRDLVLNGIADLGLYNAPIQGTALRPLTVMTDRLLLYARPVHPIFLVPEEDRTEALRNAAFAVSYRGTASRQSVERWAHASNVRLHVVLEAQTLDALKYAAESSDVVAVLPTYVTDEELRARRLQVVTVPGMPLEHRTSLVSAAKRSLPPPMRTVVAELRRVLADPVRPTRRTARARPSGINDR